MITFNRELIVYKLNNNKKRLNYLKLMSVVSLLIDIITFISLASIDLYFDNFTENMGLLFCYFAKVIIFILLGILIISSIIYQKHKILLISAILYFIIGLGLFFYLIIEEMTTSKDMQKISDLKPEIYYEVFLKLIIALNVIGGVFRMLGVIFMLIYVRIIGKIVKLIKELNENLLEKSNIMDTSIQDPSKSKQKTGYHSVAQKSHITNFTSKYYSASFTDSKIIKDSTSKKTNFLPTPYPKLNVESVNHTINENSDHSDLSIFINNEPNTNNIYVNVYNYNMPGNQTKNHKRLNMVPQFSSTTYESIEDKEKNNNLESLYETPKKMSFV